MLLVRSQHKGSSELPSGGPSDVTGNNVLSNPSFDSGPAGWTVSIPAGSIVQFADGHCRIERGPGATNAGIRQDVLEIGKPYIFEMLVSDLTYVANGIFFGANNAGQILVVTKTGISRLIVPSVSSNQFVIRGGSDGAKGTIEWATARRMDIGVSQLILTLRDFDGDKKQTSVELGPVTDGASYVTREGQAAALRDAVNAVAGNIARYQFQAQDTAPNDVNAASLVYQTHIRWIVEWVDSVTGDGPYQTDIPTAKLDDNTLVLAGSTDHNPAHADWIAFKAAFNGIVINPRTGSTVTITRIFLEE